ncbi:MAG: amidohydrolase [Isosphaeraceae bacterium]
MTDWREAIDRFLDSKAEFLRQVRRHFHAHPEPSREEQETTRELARLLEDGGVPYRIAPSRRGLIADSPCKSGLCRIAFRADLDALRLSDAKETDYRSTKSGVMHACGHDAHTTIALGAALALQQVREILPEQVAWRGIFQPAEEVAEGAFEMVEAGAMEGVGAVIAFHVNPDREVGRIGGRVGALTAYCEELAVTIQGEGGHSARPHQCIDPIAAAAQFINLVYQAVPRSIDVRDPVVVTFGSIVGGVNANVIPNLVRLQGTIRTVSLATNAKVKERLVNLADSLALATGTRIHLDFRHPLEGVINDPDVTATFLRAAAEVIGADRIDTIPLPSMGGEDFAGYLTHAPGAMLRLGIATPGQPRHLLHTPLFDIDERALVLGAKVMARGVVLLALEKDRP